MFTEGSGAKKVHFATWNGEKSPETAASLGAPCRPLRLAFCYTQLAVGAAPAAITRALITAEGPTTTWRAAPTLLLIFGHSENGVDGSNFDHHKFLI